MKNFLVQLGLFSIPILLVPFLETFVLPVSFFTYRSWEALKFSKVTGFGPFYPNSELYMIEEGDLGHHTSKAILKSTFWKTDELGYRNTKFIEESDVLLIGDSFFIGTGLTQKETITNRLTCRLGGTISVYCMAPAVFNDFEKLLATNTIAKPKVVIYSCVERGMLKEVEPYIERAEGLLNYIPSGYRSTILLDRFLRLYSKEWLKSRVKNRLVGRIVSPINSDMFFYEGPLAKPKLDQELFQNFRSIKSYKAYCDKRGIKFIFVPMPNKETVYYDLVPVSKQPDYLTRLADMLDAEGIANIRTLEIYNTARMKNSELLYHFDDTHWNGRSTELMSEVIKTKLESISDFKPKVKK